MMRHRRVDRPALITTAPESFSEELGRRKTRYAIMAAIFIASFSSAALLHRDTALALLLCGVAIVTLVLAVIGANVRSPRRRPASPVQLVNKHCDRPRPGNRRKNKDHAARGTHDRCASRRRRAGPSLEVSDGARV